MKRTMTRRFYKTSSPINAPHILKLYSEAVASAELELAENPDKEEIYIVEVIAVVQNESPTASAVNIRLAAVKKEYERLLKLSESMVSNRIQEINRDSRASND